MAGSVRPGRGAVVVLGAVGLLLSACSTRTIPVRTTITPAEEPIPTLATTSSGNEFGLASPASTGADPQVLALVDKITLRAGDLPGDSGLTVRPATGGDQVGGQATLDNCGHRFSTERHRVARRQVAVLDSAGTPIGMSHEVVVYASPDYAGQALREWHASVTACRKGTMVQPSQAGASRVRYESETTVSDDALPVGENTVTTIVTTRTADRSQRHRTAVLQRQGAALSIIWLETGAAPRRSQLTRLRSVAQATGHRLAEG